MLIERIPHSFAILRMNKLDPLLDRLSNLFMGITEHFCPASIALHYIMNNIPIPKTEFATSEHEGELFFIGPLYSLCLFLLGRVQYAHDKKLHLPCIAITGDVNVRIYN